jgi:hypothetical protein
MADSKGIPFTLQDCWKILKHCEKWKTRDQESKPKREDILEYDDSEDEDGGTNKVEARGKQEGKREDQA